ncbi:MAG TPA: HEAT repeat domain-containing protein [Chthoniobacteraceae bacterium]|nr:HEAT repeat domain-containing protein [Chthoniobacteraceae bacterium]
MSVALSQPARRSIPLASSESAAHHAERDGYHRRLPRRALIVWGVLLLAACGAFAAEPPKADPAKLAAQLGSPEVAVKREALYQLGKLGPAAKAALPAIVTALDDPDKQVWTGALAVIASIGPDAAETVPIIIQNLDPGKAKPGTARDRQQLLVRSAFALSKIGAPALPPLIAALEDANAPRRAGAARALGEMGPAAAAAAPALVKNVGHADETVRLETADALGQIGAPAVAPLIAALPDPDEKVRQGAANALAQIGKPAIDAAKPLAALLAKETAVPVRAAALVALSRVGAAPEVAVPLLVEGALNDDAEVRHAAINGLLGNRALTEKAVSPLIAALRSDSLPRRQRVALVLGRMGPTAKPAVPSLIEHAHRETTEPAYGDALSAIGAPAIPLLVEQIATRGTPAEHEWIFKALRGIGAPAVGPLTAALASQNPAVRAGAASAFTGMSITAPEAIKALVALVGDKDPTVRAAALRAVSGIRSEQASVLPKVEAALGDPNPQVRQAAAAALAAMGAVGKLGVDGLLELLKDPDLTTQRNTLQSIGSLGAGGAKAVPALIARLEQADTRVATITALGQIGEASKPAVPKLVGYVENGPDEEKLAAVRALTGIGPASEPALPVLYKLLKASNRDVQIAAVESLVKLEPDDDKLLPVMLPLVMAGNNNGLRRAAAGGLKRFGDKAQPAVPVLLKMLEQDNERTLALGVLKGMKVHAVEELIVKLEDRSTLIRTFACEALGKLGAEAEPALPTLQRRVQLDSDVVRAAAKKAIEQITKKG